MKYEISVPATREPSTICASFLFGSEWHVNGEANNWMRHIGSHGCLLMILPRVHQLTHMCAHRSINRAVEK